MDKGMGRMGCGHLCQCWVGWGSGGNGFPWGFGGVGSWMWVQGCGAVGLRVLVG